MSAIYPPDFSFHYSSNSEELNPIQLLGFGAEDAYLRHAERVWADASFTASRLAALACKRLPIDERLHRSGGRCRIVVGFRFTHIFAYRVGFIDLGVILLMVYGVWVSLKY